MPTDGVSVLKPGKLAALVTYLVHDLDDEMAELEFPGGYTLSSLGAEDLDRYRDLFRRVGSQWLWFSRLRMPDNELRTVLASNRVEALALVGSDGACGLLELDFRDAGMPELAFFGLVPEAVGTGLGRALMAEALRRAKTAGAQELHVHTCSLDHPEALEFYCRAGFRPVRRAIEIFDDPRLDGTLDRDVAAWMPVIAP